MIRRVFPSLIFGICLVAAGVPAAAQQPAPIPGLTLSFVTPTGTGTPTSSFDVYIRLSLAAGSNNFNFDAAIPPTYGLPAGFVYPNFASITDAFMSTSQECSGTFINGCGAGAYTFNFNTNTPTLVGLHKLSITAGSFQDFLFGTFSPTGGSAAAGTYTFYNATAVIEFDGVDGEGQAVYDYVDLAATCQNRVAACAFTRTVTATGVTTTPEPATVGFMVLGLGALGVVARRRRTVV
jgi:hypothetical protein